MPPGSASVSPCESAYLIASVRGGELRVLRVREHPLSMQVHPLTAKSTPSKWKENLMKHPLKPISNKFKVVLMFILGLCLGKTVVIENYSRFTQIALWTERLPMEKHPLAFWELSTYGKRVSMLQSP